MFTASAAPVLALVALGLVLPGALRPYLLGAVLALGDVGVISGPLQAPAPWFAFVAFVAREAHPAPGRLVQRCATLAGVLLLLLPLYDLFAIALAGSVFADHFQAMPNTAFFKQDLAQPVGVVPAHFNQLAYLGLGVAAALVTAAAFEGREARRGEQKLERLLVGFAATGGAIALWQWTSFSGAWFPTAFFHSGARTLAYDQVIGGVRRVSGSFAEPSSLANQLAPAVCALVAAPTVGAGAAQRWAAAALGTTALLLSTSSTGYIALPLVPASLVLGCSVRALHAWRAGEGISRRLSGDAAVAALALTAMLVFTGLIAVQPHARDVIRETLLAKDRTSSFVERKAADRLALELMVETFGLGVGLGGHVASDAWLTVGAGLGVFGLAAFAVALGGALRPASWGKGVRAMDRLGVEALAVGLALAAGEVVVNAVSGANINQPLLWLTVGYAIRGYATAQRRPALWLAAARRAPPVGRLGTGG